MNSQKLVWEIFRESGMTGVYYVRDMPSGIWEHGAEVHRYYSTWT